MTTPSRPRPPSSATGSGATCPSGPLTTYGVGGPAALFLEHCGPDDLMLAREAVAATGVPVLIVGRGSNLLVADGGFPGLALTLGDDFTAIHRDDRRAPLVRAGGGLSLPVLARRTAALGLRGLEWAVGVPGTVGGGVRMNAGGHGSDIAATLTRAWLFDLATAGDGGGAVEVSAGDLDLGYRHSAVGPTQVVVAAEFALAAGDRAEAEAEIAAVVKWRQGAPARRIQRRLGVRQPAGRLRRAAHRGRRPPGPSPGIRVCVPQTCQLLPGRPRRLGRRRPGPDRRGANDRGKPIWRRPNPREPPDRLRSLTFEWRLRVDPRFRQRRIEARRQEGRRRFRVLVGITAVAALGCAGWAATDSVVLDLDRVVVEGAVHTARRRGPVRVGPAPGRAHARHRRGGRRPGRWKPCPGCRRRPSAGSGRARSASA